MPENKISAVVITLNEEAVIEDCITSLEQVADEIIVLDSFSTDKTKELVAHRCRFVEHAWMGYSKTKNYANVLASHNLILSLDADERLDDLAIEEIKRIKQLDKTAFGYSFNRKNFYGNLWIKYAGWYPDRKTRLFDRQHSRWKGDYVHEELEVRGSVEHLAGNILHYTVKDHGHHLHTVRRYAKLAAEKAREEGKSMYALKSALSAVSHFIKIFVLKQGFRHGSVGFQIAWNSAYSKWLRYVYYIAAKRA